MNGQFYTELLLVALIHCQLCWHVGFFYGFAESVFGVLALLNKGDWPSYDCSYYQISSIIEFLGRKLGECVDQKIEKEKEKDMTQRIYLEGEVIQFSV